MQIFEMFEARLFLVGGALVCLLSPAQLASATLDSVQASSQVQPKQETKPSGGNAKPVRSPLSKQVPGQSTVTIAPQISVESGKTGVEKKIDSEPQSSLLILGRGLLETLKIVVSWPFVVAALLLYLAFFKSAPSRLKAVLKPFRSLKFFGTELVLTDEVGADAEKAIEDYRKQVKRRFDSLIETHDIRAKLEAVIDEVQPIINSHAKSKITDLRCTLHVPDILFADSIYQLLDYYPLVAGTGGRTFSSRFGIIGLCWRSRKDQIQGEVPIDRDDLIRNWGMNEEQASASGRGRQSFLAVILRDHSGIPGTPVAIFYMDAKEKNAFGADNEAVFRDQMREKVISASNTKGLIASLEKLRDDFKDRKPLIHIHAQ